MKHFKLLANVRATFGLIALSFTIFSCDNAEESNKQDENQKNGIESIKVVDGTVEIENKTTLRNLFNSYKESAEQQNDFHNEIRHIQNEGFKPLTPIFDENDSDKIEKFIAEKKAKLHQRNEEYGVFSKSAENEISLDDELIEDPAFARLLNEDREIIVGDSLYKYTETGLYMCKTENKEKLHNYLEKLTSSQKKQQLQKIKSMTAKAPAEYTEVGDGIVRFVPQKIEEISPDYSGGGGGSTAIAPTPSTSPRLIKQNLEIAYVEKNSIWEKVFGASDKSEDYYSDNRRIQVSFWNQNYFIFSSVGCSARLQKREKTLGVSYWEKSYADVIELGVNSIQYDYKFNTAKFDQAAYNYKTVFFEYNGVKYNIDGKILTKLPTSGPGFIFDTGHPEEGLTIFIHNNEYDLLNAKELNLAIDNLVKLFAQNIPSWADKTLLNNKIKNESLVYNVVKAPSLSNKVTFRTMNVKWGQNDENAITHYFDFNFVFTWKSNYNGIDDYLKGLIGATTYSNVSADIYGAALHNNEWKGRRLLLNNN